MFIIWYIYKSHRTKYRAGSSSKKTCFTKKRYLPADWRLMALLGLDWSLVTGLLGLKPAGGFTDWGWRMEGWDWRDWRGPGNTGFGLAWPGYTGETGLLWTLFWIGAGFGAPPKRSAILSRNESGSADLPPSDLWSRMSKASVSINFFGEKQRREHLIFLTNLNLIIVKPIQPTW